MLTTSLPALWLIITSLLSILISSKLFGERKSGNPPFLPLFKNASALIFRICCLGGGPGSEVLAIAAVAIASKKDLHVAINVFDNAEWEDATDDLFNAIESDWGVSQRQLKPRHFVCDILDDSPILEYIIIFVSDSLISTSLSLFQEAHSIIGINHHHVHYQ